MTKLTITAVHPARAAITSLPTYHESKGQLLCAVYDALAEHGILMDSVKLDGSEGYVNVPLRPAQTVGIVCECCAAKADRAEFANCLALSWYTMQSGRIELTAYIS